MVDVDPALERGFGVVVQRRVEEPITLVEILKFLGILVGISKKHVCLS